MDRYDQELKRRICVQMAGILEMMIALVIDGVSILAIIHQKPAECLPKRESPNGQEPCVIPLSKLDVVEMWGRSFKNTIILHTV